MRRIAMGSGYVAFATAGGVRLWDGRQKRWREWTIREGLTSLNVVDVAFDPEALDSRLWALSVDGCFPTGSGGAVTGGRLHLSVLSPADGTVLHTETPSPRAPVGESTGYQDWVEYRLRVTPAAVFVYGERGAAALTFDRRAGTWSTDVSAAPPPPPTRLGPPLYRWPGHLYALHDLGRGLVVLDFAHGSYLYDARPVLPDADGVPRFAPFSWPATSGGGEYPAPHHSPQMDLRVDPDRPGTVSFAIVEQKRYDLNAIDVPVERTWLVSLRAAIEKDGAVMREVSRRPLTGTELSRFAARAAALQRSADAPPLLKGALTDIAVEPDGGALWFATCNPRDTRAPRIARYDRATHLWTYAPLEDGGK